jgi:hypothetical protein
MQTAHLTARHKDGAHNVHAFLREFLDARRIGLVI